MLDYILGMTVSAILALQLAMSVALVSSRWSDAKLNTTSQRLWATIAVIAAIGIVNQQALQISRTNKMRGFFDKAIAVTQTYEKIGTNYFTNCTKGVLITKK